jgi:hypothetical protein
MMSQRTARPHQGDISDDKQRFVRLLNDALDLADAVELPPEIGARLQEVIDLATSSSDRNAALH